jgi:multicomponent Na+:H+ antiporter subunit E
LALQALGLAGLWAILTGGRGWVVGIPVILLACLAGNRSAFGGRWSVAGVVRFLPYFAWNSLQGGVDVALRALHPRLPIDPGLLHYETRLDLESARILMANTVTLLPGTLSADLRGNGLTVHVLNARGPTVERLAQLERRVADLFGLDLRPAE